MKPSVDPLYFIFEQHLMNALVEDEGSQAFIQRVVEDYILKLRASGSVIPSETLSFIEQDLQDEVLEMLRKKTYGHHNITEFRKSKGIVSANTTEDKDTVETTLAKTRRSRRAC